LLIIGGLYALGIFLSNTFVNVYLWRQTNDYLTIAFYNFAIFIVQPLTYLVVGKVVKMIDRIFFLRTCDIFLTIFYILLLIFFIMDTNNLFFDNCFILFFYFYCPAINLSGSGKSS